jgi:hypothetical protein
VALRDFFCSYLEGDLKKIDPKMVMSARVAAFCLNYDLCDFCDLCDFLRRQGEGNWRQGIFFALIWRGKLGVKRGRENPANPKILCILMQAKKSQ